MVEDSRAPLYGRPAPLNLRVATHLQESFVELFPDRKTGPGFSFGRRMLVYGEGRVLNSPQWGNVVRTFDHLRVYHRAANSRVEALFVSPAPARLDAFNRPVLSEHVWGVYATHRRLDAYVLKHRAPVAAGGYNTFSSGARLALPPAPGWNVSLEAIAQGGEIRSRPHRAFAWHGTLARTVGNVTVSGEYKYASGTRDPSSGRSGTYDLLYPVVHDRFGHEDLIGWRNIHNTRAMAVAPVNSRVSVTLMYNASWLASARDALYNGTGRALISDPSGRSGRYVGQEIDLFGTYRRGHFTFGAGAGYFVSGTFIQRTTPGMNPIFLYVSQTVTY